MIHPAIPPRRLAFGAQSRDARKKSSESIKSVMSSVDIEGECSAARAPPVTPERKQAMIATPLDAR